VRSITQRRYGDGDGVSEEGMCLVEEQRLRREKDG
jgi:hypothetical protein